MKAYVDRLVYHRHDVIARCLTMISLFRHDLRSTVTLQHTYKKLKTMTGILPKCISFEDIPLMILPHFKTLKCMAGSLDQSKEA